MAAMKGAALQEILADVAVFAYHADAVI